MTNSAIELAVLSFRVGQLWKVRGQAFDLIIHLEALLLA